jgi:hypothetical protein
MKITGTVTYVQLSGGFWGIKSDDGQQFTPASDLPEKFRVEGLRIEAKAKPVEVFSISMWGQHVELTDIKALAS